MAGRYERLYQQALQIYGLLRDHMPERPPPLLLSVRYRPPPANQTLALEFVQPRYHPLLKITEEDLAPFNPRDWEAFLASLTAASPPPSSAEKTEARTFPVEVALAIALAGATVLFAAAFKYRKMRRRALRGGGGGSGGGGGWGRRRFGGEPTGVISLLPRRRGARMTRLPFDEAGCLACAAEADGPAWLARLAAAGTLGRDDEDELELLRRVVLLVRKALPVLLLLESQKTGADLSEHLASVSEWKNVPSDKETDDYKAATLTKMGTIVWPLIMDTRATEEREKTRKELVDNCNCSHPKSEECVRVHVMKARVWIKDQLGEEAFRNCGLDAMGEQVEELWSAADKQKLEDAAKLISQNKHQKFMKVAPKELSETDLAKYYYNVFLPRRLASLTRAEHKKDGALDTDD